MSSDIQRVRDPIHGLIKFEDDTDKLAWRLLETPEFQRLRRIRQLGFSEFIFPSATHTRFAHSIGVYHNARRLMKVVERAEGKDKFKPDRASVILLAALLHDIGHGPFSHAFEKAREEIAIGEGRGLIEKHEKFSAKIIRNKEGSIFSILEKVRPNLAEEIATIIDTEDPVDIYHAVVSSSFDADRLDYLVRDRYMTGTGAGAIDVDWLIDNLTEKFIIVSQDDDAESQNTPTFVFKFKGRQAAEDFLLARYRLYTEVYLHKTTRGFEAILARLLRLVGDSNLGAADLNLELDNPLMRFLRGEETIDIYLELDDFSVWSGVKRIANGPHKEARELALRLITRDHLHVLDLFSECGNDQAKLANAERDIENFAGDELGISIFKDAPSINLYTTQSGEAEKLHKVVRVLDGTGVPREISYFAETIINASLIKKRRLIRYYFLTREKRDEAAKTFRGR
jgi:uncharacterized protein